MSNGSYTSRARDLVIMDDDWWAKYMTITSLLNDIYKHDPRYIVEIIDTLRHKLKELSNDKT